MANSGKMKWRVALLVLCMGIAALYSKVEREVYPAIIFPSFGTPLETGASPEAVSISLRLETDEGLLRLSVSEWFDGPQPSVHDSLATRLIDLPSAESDWLFGEAARFTASCVSRIDVVRSTSGSPDVVENSFPGSC